jgi:hypothetical protein
VLLLVVMTAVNPRVDAAEDGAELLSECSPVIRYLEEDSEKSRDLDSAYGAGACLGLLHGIEGANLALRQTRGERDGFFCAPKEDIGDGRAVRIIVEFVSKHPERLHEPKAALALSAFKDAFPCK